MSIFVYDAGVLIAADKDDRSMWAKHRARMAADITLLVPSVVVAQVSRSPQQAQLRRFLEACTVVPLDEPDAHRAGRLLAQSKTTDVVDAVVVTIAIRNQATILTSDPADINRLVRASGYDIPVIRI